MMFLQEEEKGKHRDRNGGANAGTQINDGVAMGSPSGQQMAQLLSAGEILGAVKVRDGLFLGDEFSS